MVRRPNKALQRTKRSPVLTGAAARPVIIDWRFAAGRNVIPPWNWTSTLHLCH
jgi:hypothetical protein